MGDLVYFPRKETGLDSKWIMGVVEKLQRGRDGLIRMVDIRYRTSIGHEVTNRTIRKVVKLWGIEDIHLDEDLAELTKRFQLAQEVVNAQEVGADAEANHPDGEVSGDRVGDQVLPDDDVMFQVEDSLAQQPDDPNSQPGGDGQDPQEAPDALDIPATNTRSRKCAKCCCTSHHTLSAHPLERQLGDIPQSACKLEVDCTTELFTKVQGESSYQIELDSVEGILWAVDSDITL